jgi:hypothetical protein
MGYTSVSSFVDRATQYMEDNCLANDSSFLESEIISRIANVVFIPASFIANSLDTTIGLIGFVGVLGTGGMLPPVNKFAFFYLERVKYIVADPYEHLFHAINYNASFGERQDLSLMYIITRHLFEYTTQDPNPKGFLEEHVITRLKYGLLAITAVITFIADAIFAIPVAAFAILTVGKIDYVNELAYALLRSTQLIDTIAYAIIKFLNPKAQF